MNVKQKKRTSVNIARILRHCPEDAGLSLDKEGWGSISTLIQAVGITRDQLFTIVVQDDKGRYQIDSDRQMIRAVQGHSTSSVNLSFSNVTPPSVLYHGTAQSNIESILQDGLKPRRRHHVHLSSSTDVAVRVGTRHGKPEVFMVDAGSMDADGYAFMLSDNGVWLTDAVPPKYLTLISQGQ